MIKIHLQEDKARLDNVFYFEENLESILALENQRLLLKFLNVELIILNDLLKMDLLILICLKL